jgi:heat shock protein HspQ
MMSSKPVSTRAPRKPSARNPAKAAEDGAAAAKPATGKGAMNVARYRVGDVVKHRVYPFRGIVFDIDPVFNSTEEWWQSIPEQVRPRKDQPFYHLLAENAETEYVAYVSEQNLLPDTSGEPLRHPKVPELFIENEEGRYIATFMQRH